LNPNVAEFTLSKKEFEFWKSSLPAMADVCRDWDHKDTCEYIQSPDLIATKLCSCGMGHSISSAVKSEFQTLVARIAVSPLSGAPYLEQMRGLIKASGLKGVRNPAALLPALNKSPNSDTLSIPQDHKREKPTGITMEPQKPKCKVCGKDSAKKCGRCKQAVYCSRQCQSSDWSAHKFVCEAA
jgi:MYND finger